MNFSYEDLHDETRFRLVYALHHDQLKSFLTEQIRNERKWSLFLNIFQLTALALFFAIFVKIIYNTLMGKEFDPFYPLFGGIIFSFTLLIIIHELLHGLAYLMIGARHISFGAEFQKFIFYAQADRQVLNRKHFHFVALFPFIIVNLVTIPLMFLFWGTSLFYFILPIFALHTLFCGGDFGMLCFYQNNKDKDLYVVDLPKQDITYFYQRLPLELTNQPTQFQG